MKPVRLLSLALITPLLLAMGGCDGATGPGDLGDLDPDAVTAAMNELVTPLGASREANANMRAAAGDLTVAGVAFSRTDQPMRLPSFASAWLDRALEPLAPLVSVQFPPAITGSTFEFVLDVNGWEVDETRAGAPDDGVRVVWYDLEDSQGTINVPLNERGFIDLTPRAGGAADSLVMVIVETLESGDITLLDLVQARETVGTAAVIDSFRAAGTYSDGTTPIDFVIVSEETEETGSGDMTYLFEVALEGAEASYVWRANGSVNGASGAFEDNVRATAVHEGFTTVLNLQFRGTDGIDEEASGTIEQDGTLIANVDIEGNSFDFSTPDGDSFSPEQASQLNRLFRALTLNGPEVLLSLPLFLPA